MSEPPKKRRGNKWEREQEAKNKKKEEENAALKTETEHTASTKVFVGNLPYDVEEQAVHDFFEGCGTVTEITWQMPEGEFRCVKS